MGRSFYNLPSGSLSNGGKFTTSVWEYTQDRVNADAHTLVVAVSTSLLKPAALSITGSNSASIYATLSGAYNTAVAAGI